MNRALYSGHMLFVMRCLFGIIAICMLPACGIMQKTAQPHSMPQPSLTSASSEPAVLPNSEVRPSRYAMLFNTLEVPPLKLEAQTPPSEEFLEQLQQAFINKIRDTQLFARVVSKAETRERDGVLTLDVSILSWDEQPAGGVIEIRLGIVDMRGRCEFTHATTRGELKRIGAIAQASSIGQYEINPLVDGVAVFVTDFMHPHPINEL